MKKKALRIVAVFIVLAIVLCPLLSASAAVDPAYRNKYDALDKLVSGAVGALSLAFPTPDWQNKSDYKTENFYEGTETFLTEPAQNAKWSLGYADASLLTGNELDGKHFVGGSIQVLPEKTATEVYDDLRARVIAVSDGSGRGTVVFAALDCYGLSNSDVRIIRARLADFAEEKNIVSINVPTLHQHSAVDTFGMNGNIFKAVFINPVLNLLNKLGFNVKLFTGKNEEYMEHLYSVTVESIKKAVNSMETGKIYFSRTDVSQYIYDKRAPYVNDTYMNRFRFVPDNAASKETWLVTSVIHCVGNGASGTEITGDYPYYMEKVVKEEAGANFMLMMGAQQSNTLNRGDFIPGMKDAKSGIEELSLFGKSLGEKAVEMSEASETEVAPLLNIKHSELFLKIDNKIMELAGKGGLFTNTVVRNGVNQYEVVTEIGYMEIGNDLAFALVPGELAPEIAYGGCLQADESWTGTDWNYPSIASLAPTGRMLRVLGLMNDQVGYIVPDNNHMSMLAPESKSTEFVSLGSATASTLVKAFEELI